MEANHFDRLGLPRDYTIDVAALERHYLERSRAIHPDHSGNDPASLEASARLNEAYAVLRDPFRRAEYLLVSAGGPSPTAVSQPPNEFLEEMLELRMQIEEAKTEPAAAARLEQSLSERRQRLLDQAGELLASPDTSNRDTLVKVRQLLNATKFINGLLRDLREESSGA